MATVLRFLFVIPFGFVAACLAGAFALIWPFVGRGPDWSEDPLYWIEAATGFAFQAMQVGSVSFLPWALFMAATEILGRRSLLLHAAAGLAGAFSVLRLAYPGEPPHGSVRTAMLVAGLAFGLVYWLIAGRGAGRWRRRFAFQRDGVTRIDTAKPKNTEAKT